MVSAFTEVFGEMTSHLAEARVVYADLKLAKDINIKKLLVEGGFKYN